MKKTIIALLTMASVSYGVDYTFTTTYTSDNEYQANNGASYYGVAFTLNTSSDRYTSPANYTGKESNLLLDSIMLTVRHGYTMPTTLSLIVTDSSGLVLGWAQGNEQTSTNKGIIDNYTRTYATFTLDTAVSVKSNAVFYAYFTTSELLDELIEAKGNNSLTLDATNFKTYAQYGQQLAVTKPINPTSAYDNTKTAEWNVVSTIGTLNHTDFAPVMSVNLSTAPEPTTATLSLLALAGLAARRRRR